MHKIFTLLGGLISLAGCAAFISVLALDSPSTGEVLVRVGFGVLMSVVGILIIRKQTNK